MANNRKDVFLIIPPKSEGGKAFWMRVGVAWVNKDGSINLKPDVAILPGQDVQLREPSEKEEKFGS